MKKLLVTRIFLAYLWVLLAVIEASCQTLPPPTIPPYPPDTTFKIRRRTGNCPNALKLWTLVGEYQGNQVYTVIADISAIAGAARLLRSNHKSAEFTAPLKSNFASCVGDAISDIIDERAYYTFQFQNKNVTFRVQLGPDYSTNLSEITYKNVLSSLPAVRWQEKAIPVEPK
ncbi:hypothetical protein [Aerosakkonema funiforme]|uniref:Uncharacterized protein n=1 Tax=Aerosakkonema funiforme FACHB-1375 TaxID=2949571 RepID=A0A926VKR0_9CYAN|nr:hypothetical protein [Aerosakkonema funiforme]MBD2185725.1 hypothetical protein [Aerosakkonema funiforme FACHB-1375]